MKRGDIVIFGNHHHNGSMEHPAIVTRVHAIDSDPDLGNVYLVNVTVFPDGSAGMAAWSQVVGFDTKEKATAWLEQKQGTKPPVVWVKPA